MKKKIIFVSIAVITLLSACGNEKIDNTIEYNTTNYITTTDNIINDTESKDASIDNEETIDKDTTTDNTTADKDTTADNITTDKETTINGAIENTSENVTTDKETDSKETIIPGVDNFDINAERVSLPDDYLLPGDDFKDAVFIGDSRTEGLTVYNVLTTSTILATRGLTAKEAYSKKFIKLEDGTKITAIDYLENNKFNRVYIMLGLNEMGGTAEHFKETYGILVDKIRETLPDAKIYAISIIPMIEERTDDTYNNPKIKKYNEALKALTEEKGITFVNAKAAVINEQGTLRDDLSKDGIHLRVPGLTMFVNYLILSTSDVYNNR